MKAVVVYESMYGNTHRIASAIAAGFRRHGEAVVVPVGEANAALVKSADLVVVGGPTHAHGMSRANTRKAAAADAEKTGSDLVLDTDADGLGLREWLESVGHAFTNAAAFDTRFDLPAAVTGRASKGIERKLRLHGARLICEPESFFVKKGNHLESNEEARANEWGEQLSITLAGTASRQAPRVAAHSIVHASD